MDKAIDILGQITTLTFILLATLVTTWTTSK
jgi:hypothetical protein